MSGKATTRRKMRGVDFVVDENGERKAVIIDLKKHRDLWEDFYDTCLARKRKDEPRESLEEVRRRVRGE